MPRLSLHTVTVILDALDVASRAVRELADRDALYLRMSPDLRDRLLADAARIDRARAAFAAAYLTRLED